MNEYDKLSVENAVLEFHIKLKSDSIILKGNKRAMLKEDTQVGYTFNKKVWAHTLWKNTLWENILKKVKQKF